MQRCWRRFNQTYQGIQITLAYNISVSTLASQNSLHRLMQHSRICFYPFPILKQYMILVV